MMEYLNNYSVVYDDAESKHILCLNKNTDALKQELSNKYGCNKNDFSENTLVDFVKGGNYEFEKYLRGSIFSTEVVIHNEDIIPQVLDDFNEHLSENDLNDICENRSDMFEIVWKIVDETIIESYTLELKSMLSKLKRGELEDW